MKGAYQSIERVSNVKVYTTPVVLDKDLRSTLTNQQDQSKIDELPENESSFLQFWLFIINLLILNSS